jgi:hypothetical protein
LGVRSTIRARARILPGSALSREYRSESGLGPQRVELGSGLGLGSTRWMYLDCRLKRIESSVPIAQADVGDSEVVESLVAIGMILEGGI